MSRQRRILLNAVLPNPWIPISEELEKHGHKIVYWIGWGSNGKREQVESKLPHVVFHENILAWKGIAPDAQKINLVQPRMLPLDFWQSNTQEIMIAMKMLDRLDADGYSFNFSEREDFIFDLATQWYNTLLNYKIDTVIYSVTPHRGFDFIIYLVAKYLGIDTLMFRPSFEPSFIYGLEDILGEPLKIDNSNISGFDRNKLLDKCKKFQEDQKFTPDYMINQQKTNNLKTRLSKLTSKIRPSRILKTDLNANKYRHIDYYGLFPKNIDTAYVDSVVSLKSIQALKKACYDEVRELPENPAENYLLFALHYQPEETTVPTAGRFYNQLSVIKQLAQQLPNGWKLLVKEHTSQFHPKMDGYKGRYKEFYSRVAQFENVVLIDPGIHSRQLLKKVKAVVTLTGTIGIESLLCGVPVILFGNAWYRNIPGVIDIGRNPKLLERIDQVLMHLPEVKDEQIFAYVQEFTKFIIPAYAYKNYEKRATFDDQKNASIVAEYILKWFDSKN